MLYAASMMIVPETVIHKTQTELFAFLWKNKKDKIKRQAVCQPTSEGGLNFINFGIMVKPFRLSWIAGLLEDTNDNWEKIPNYYFNKYCGLSFLLSCNYNTKCIDKNLPLFYREMLQYYHDLSSMYEGPQKSEFILRNNKRITIDKTCFSGNVGLKKLSILCKICLMEKVNFYLFKISRENLN